MSAKRVIWKYQWERPGMLEISVPPGAKVLHVDSHGRWSGGEVATIWVMVDALSDEREKRMFVLVATGQEFYTSSRDLFHGTLFLGPHVFHVFEVVS